MTSGGKRKPAKADRGIGAGRGRRVRMPTVSLLKAVTANATEPGPAGLAWRRCTVAMGRSSCGIAERLWEYAR